MIPAGRRGCHVVVAVAVLLLPSSRPVFGGDAPTSARAVLEEARTRGSRGPAAIAEALGPASPRRIAELRLLLGDEDAFVRCAAVQTLSAFGDRPVQSLARLLDDEDRAVRLAAEEALADAGHPAVEVLGEILLTHSCLSESLRAATRVLARVGDPAGVPYLANVLVKYRTGGFPQQAGMEALRAIGGPPAVAQLLQLTAFKELGEQAYLALMAMDREALLRSVGTLLDDDAADPQLRLAYALQLNEIAGTAAAAPVLVKFFGSLAGAADLPPELRRKGASLRNLFAAEIRKDAQYFRAPLTQQRLNALFATAKEDEDSPFIEARRQQEREMDAIRAERRRAEQPFPAGLVIRRRSMGGNLHTLP
jgi:hypothetical protein